MTQFISGIGGILTNLSIVAIDSNALNKIWNSKCTNARWTEWESVISDNCLQILNQPLDQLSFVPAGTSFLDLTLAGSSALAGAWKLLCNSNPESSDLFSPLNVASVKLSCIGLPTVICIDGIEILEPLAILEKCAQNFFPEPPPSEDAHLPAEKLAESYSFSSQSRSFIFPPITAEELASMNVKSSPGLDGLSTALINSCFPLITDDLLKIMNACFSLSYFPTCWKAAKVVVIVKPNKPAYDSFNSFRPISVVNTLAKVLEKLILSRVRWVASTCQWLSPSQHGFIQGRSTESAAHSLISFF